MKPKQKRQIIIFLKLGNTYDNWHSLIIQQLDIQLDINNCMNQSVKDIISGFVSGWVQVIIMQPFQIVKIRLQTQSSTNPYYNGMVDCFKKIAKEEGLFSFYKGTLTPLIGIGFQASAMFFTCEWAKRTLRKYQQNPKQKLQLKLMPFAGLIASLPTSLVASPVQHARIRIQIQKDKILYHGSVDAGVQITKQFGLRGLYRGFFPTWLRQAIGQVAYFTTYQFILRLFIREGQKQAPIVASLGAGAFAGVAFFLAAYPADYIKTLMQTDNLDKKQAKYSSLLDCAKQRYQAAGVGTFYKGLGVALYRAAAVNAGGFFAFESCSRMLGKQQQHH